MTSPYMTMEDNSFFILVPKKYFLIEYESRFIVKVMSMPKFTVELMLWSCVGALSNGP
jgi:hypothetical protein